MKRMILATTAALLGFSAQVQAHDLWVVGENKDVLKTDIVYGHGFPAPEAIQKERTVLFEPIKVVGNGYEEVLKQKGENYHYEGKKLAKGTYFVLAKYKPTAWIEKEDGKWEMNKTRKDTSEAVKYCGISTMAAKSIMVVGDDDGAFALKPLGKGLEFTPLAKPDAIKKDAPIRFKLTRDGQPVKQAKVFGSFGGFSSNDETSVAFYATTDLKGEFEFKALKEGLWYLKTTVNTDSGDKNCEIFNDKASLSFMVR